MYRYEELNALAASVQAHAFALSTPCLLMYYLRGALVGASIARLMYRYKDLNAAAAAFKHTHFALSTPRLFCLLSTIEILTSCCDLYVL